MEYTGLLRKYKLNRKLSKSEKENQLCQAQKIDKRINHELTTIEINSTYIEIVDKFFFWKGWLTTGCAVLLTLIAVLLLAFLKVAITERLNDFESWLALLFVFAVFSPLIFLLSNSIHKEINLTHYPIRFNRKARKIFAFRPDGKILTADWDQVFFTQVSVSGKYWEFQCHILDKDGETILETFALPALAYGVEEKEDFKGYWEFIRRYMEEGPASVIDNITACLPIKKEKETLKFSYQRLAYSLGGPSLFMLLYYTMCYPGRILTMHYSKIPQWPREIEEQCPVEPNDPYFKDATSNPN